MTNTSAHPADIPSGNGDNISCGKDRENFRMSDSPRFSLNPIQQAAVEHPINAPLKVIAGAGTGKTMVLTHRFVHILKEHPEIAPQNILALTFTNKAAAEMKERIIELAKEAGIVHPNTAFPPQLWIGTFHSFCGRILRENAFAAGLDPDFTVLGEADIRQIHHRIVNDFVNLRLDTGDFNPDECQYVRFENPGFLYSHVSVLISKLKDQLVSPDEFREMAHSGMETYYPKLDNLFDEATDSSELASATKRTMKRRWEETVPHERAYEFEMIEIIYHIYKAYQDYLTQNDMLDFGDLIFRAYRLLESNERVKQRYQERFKYILVDEFQDTNEAQFNLLALLAQDEELSNVTVVGDDKQAIYGWRNARVENVDDFEAEAWGGHSLNVSKNYRSYGEILNVAHFSIVQDEKFLRQSDEIKLEAERLGMAEEARVILYDADSREREAEIIAQEIAKLLTRGVELDDIAILMRSLSRVRIYEDALRRSQIPYRTVGGTGFYDRQEIRDILAYLRVIDDPFDMQALIRTLKRPPIGLNDYSLYRLRRKEDTELFDSLSYADELLEGPEIVSRIQRFLHLLEEMWGMIGEGSIFYLASQLIERSGYLKYVHGMPPDDRERSLANIRKLLRMASEFERKHPFGGLRDFVQYVQFSMDQLVIEGEAGPGLERKAVQIMTVHQAKGLEFDVVFVINAGRPSFPTVARHPMFALHKEDGLIINTDWDGDKFFKYKPHDLKKNSHLYQEHGIINHYEEFRKEHLGEERRIWYVAMTRARQYLYLSCPKPLTGDAKRGSGADFIMEILEEFADKGTICEFRSAMEAEDHAEAELPLWKSREESIFKNIEEAEEYEKQLMELITMWRTDVIP
ncbi:ATP-dependent helicase [Candidatus Poribacteria bacterium]